MRKSDERPDGWPQVEEFDLAAGDEQTMRVPGWLDSLLFRILSIDIKFSQIVSLYGRVAN
jgi:hypothetical protein